MDLASELGKNSSGITEKDGSEPVFVNLKFLRLPPAKIWGLERLWGRQLIALVVLILKHWDIMFFDLRGHS